MGKISRKPTYNIDSFDYDELLFKLSPSLPASVYIQVPSISEFYVLYTLTKICVKYATKEIYTQDDKSDDLDITRTDFNLYTYTESQGVASIFWNDNFIAAKDKFHMFSKCDSFEELIENNPGLSLFTYFMKWCDEKMSERLETGGVKSRQAKNKFIVAVLDCGHWLHPNADSVLKRNLKDLFQKQDYSSAFFVFLDSKPLVIDPMFYGYIGEHQLRSPSDKELGEFIEFYMDRQEITHIDLKARKNELVSAVKGLEIPIIKRCVSHCIRRYNAIDERIFDVLWEQKLVKLKEANLDYITVSSPEIGGLTNLKKWVSVRAKFINKAQTDSKLKIDMPKGVLLVGIPGTGKSLAAKAIAYEFNLPLIRLDVSVIFNSLVGESEKQLKSILNKLEFFAPCVFWVDEIEKIFDAQTNGDSGVSSRLLSILLTWMQERREMVFAVATANNVGKLPPELIRKERFDEIFYLDLPDSKARFDIIKIALNKFGYSLEKSDLDIISDRTEGFTGAELMSTVKELATEAYIEECEFNLPNLLNRFSNITPMSVYDREKLTAITNLAKKGIRHAG